MNIRTLVLLVIVLATVGCATAHVSPVTIHEVGEVLEPLQSEEVAEPLPILQAEAVHKLLFAREPLVPELIAIAEPVTHWSVRENSQIVVTATNMPGAYNVHGEVPPEERIFIGDSRDETPAATIDTNNTATTGSVKVPQDKVAEVAEQSFATPAFVPWTLAVVLFVVSLALFFALLGEQAEVKYLNRALRSARDEAHQARMKILEFHISGKKHHEKARALERRLAEAERENEEPARDVAQKGEQLHALMNPKKPATPRVAKPKPGKTHNAGRAVRKKKKPPGRASAEGPVKETTVH